MTTDTASPPFSEIDPKVEAMVHELIGRVADKWTLLIVPPKVEYQLTELGHGLSESFCGVWRWVESNLDAVEAARQQFDARLSG